MTFGDPFEDSGVVLVMVKPFKGNAGGYSRERIFTGLMSSGRKSKAS